MSNIGFHVWNPAGRLPTRVHDTLASAVTEAERLTRENPGQRFVVMSPVISAKDAFVAKAYSDGKAEGYALAQGEIMRAEARLDKAWEELHSLRRVKDIVARAESLQSIAADAQCWFEGFAAAFTSREGWERPHIPDIGRLRGLVEHLRRLRPDVKDASDLDDEIPF